jgi:hypothetical protein
MPHSALIRRVLCFGFLLFNPEAMDNYVSQCNILLPYLSDYDRYSVMEGVNAIPFSRDAIMRFHSVLPSKAKLIDGAFYLMMRERRLSYWNDLLGLLIRPVVDRVPYG